MKQLLGAYNFAESWSEIGHRIPGPDGKIVGNRLGWADKEVNLNIGMFTDLDCARALVVDSDCTPVQLQSFMVKVSVALSYCSVMIARIGSILVDYQEGMDKKRAQKASALIGQVKSDAALERQLEIDMELIDLKWSIEDLKVMKEYAENIFKVLQKDAEHWRARFYGAHQDQKLTPGLNDPGWTTGPGSEEGVPPRIGGQRR